MSHTRAHKLVSTSLVVMSGLKASARWGVASRALAAILGGYVLAHTLSILLAVLLPLERANAALLAIQLSFVVYAGAALWVFAARSAWLAWQGVMVPATLCGLVAWAWI